MGRTRRGRFLKLRVKGGAAVNKADIRGMKSKDENIAPDAEMSFLCIVDVNPLFA
jgi:hypothetical protein